MCVIAKTIGYFMIAKKKELNQFVIATILRV
jgi:hypothetical protein